MSKILLGIVGFVAVVNILMHAWQAVFPEKPDTSAPIVPAPVVTDAQRRQADIAKAQDAARARCNDKPDEVLKEVRGYLTTSPEAARRGLAECSASALAQRKEYAPLVKRAEAAAEAALKAAKKKEGVSLGMSEQDVLDSSWGRPRRVNKTTTRHGESAQWVYEGGGYLYFENGKLTAIQH